MNNLFKKFWKKVNMDYVIFVEKNIHSFLIVTVK